MVSGTRGLLVPAHLVRHLNSLSTIGLRELLRRSPGGRVPAELANLLHVMQVYEIVQQEATSANGSEFAVSDTVENASEDAGWVTSAQAARSLECSARWVTQELRTGRLPGRRVGRQWLIRSQDLTAYRQRSRRNT